MLKPCEQCRRENPEDALFCFQCGTALQTEKAAAPEPEIDDTHLWRAFIGSSKTILFSFTKGWAWGRADEHYLEKFRHFWPGSAPRFALTWHWPAFLFDPFLWFLYRKMYMYAVVYAVGPAASWYITDDPMIGMVWRVMAGASANYLYYWHVRNHLYRIRKQAGLHPTAPAALLRDAGGVQPYVVWLGIILNIAMFVVVLGLIIAGPPDDMKILPSPFTPTPARKYF